MKHVSYIYCIIFSKSYSQSFKNLKYSNSYNIISIYSDSSSNNIHL